MMRPEKTNKADPMVFATFLTALQHHQNTDPSLGYHSSRFPMFDRRRVTDWALWPVSSDDGTRPSPVKGKRHAGTSDGATKSARVQNARKCVQQCFFALRMRAIVQMSRGKKWYLAHVSNRHRKEPSRVDYQIAHGRRPSQAQPDFIFIFSARHHKCKKSLLSGDKRT